MEPWELREWYAEFLEVSNRHDLDELREFIAPNVRRAHLPAGAEAWIEDLDARFRAFPDWRWKRIQIIVEDERLAVHVRGSGTHRGEYRGVAPTRRRVNVAEFAMYRVVNGRIVEVTGSGDDELLAQIAAEDR